MEDIFGYVMVCLVALLFFFELIRQIKETRTIQKAGETAARKYKRLIFGEYLAIFSLTGFLVSFVFNVLIGLQIYYSDVLTSDNTAFACFISLLFLLIARFGIIPKKMLKNRFLKE